MLDRNNTESKLFKSPGICYYKPKFNIIEKKSNILVPFKIRKDLNNPKFKIQRLWRGFKVPTEYVMVNLDTK
jgi:hypothetical protein